MTELSKSQAKRLAAQMRSSEKELKHVRKQAEMLLEGGFNCAVLHPASVIRLLDERDLLLNVLDAAKAAADVLQADCGTALEFKTQLIAALNCYERFKPRGAARWG